MFGGGDGRRCVVPVEALHGRAWMMKGAARAFAWTVCAGLFCYECVCCGCTRACVCMCTSMYACVYVNVGVLIAFSKGSKSGFKGFAPRRC